MKGPYCGRVLAVGGYVERCGGRSGEGGGWYNRGKNQDEIIRKKMKERGKKKKREPRQRLVQLSWSYEPTRLCLSFQASAF